MHLDIIVININNLAYTRDILDDLKNQSCFKFNLTIVDQDSTEEGTSNFLSEVLSTDLPFNVTIQTNSENVDLNRVWSEFARKSREDILCFLNNDVRVTSNFVQDTLDVFNENSDLGIAVHATNHDSYITMGDELKYEIVDGLYRQGWDFSIRREVFSNIPVEIRVYCGDDYLFEKCYENNKKVAFILSSPILHYCSKSVKFRKVSGATDVEQYKKLGYEHRLKPNLRYSKIFPTDIFIQSFLRTNYD